MTVVKRLMRSEGLAVVRGQSDVECLVSFLKHIFPKMTDLEIDEILKVRCAGKADDINEIPDEVVEECFDRDDLKATKDRW